MTPRSRTRVWGAIISVVALGAVLSPLARTPSDDGFPLSTYPMFATPRQLQARLSYAVIIGADGRRDLVPPRYVSGGEVLQAAAMINRTVGGPARDQQALCTLIAGKVAASGRWPGFQAIAMVTATHDAIAFFVDDVRGAEDEEYRCPGPGGPR